LASVRIGLDPDIGVDANAECEIIEADYNTGTSFGRQFSDPPFAVKILRDPEI